MDDASTALHMGFGWESLTALSSDLKSPQIAQTRIRVLPSLDTYLSLNLLPSGDNSTKIIHVGLRRRKDNS
jgi:hypothetical protein